jgi:hypothetical protein
MHFILQFIESESGWWTLWFVWKLRWTVPYNVIITYAQQIWVEYAVMYNMC